VEAVAWLAARKEVLQGFFFFLAFYLYLLAREKERRRKLLLLSLVLISILLAVLSKPSAVVFPAVLCVYEISLRKSGGSILSRATGGFFHFRSHFPALHLHLDEGDVQRRGGKGLSRRQFP